MQQEAFGDCLTQLMQAQGVTPRELADALVFRDATLVYRWLRNERVPKLDSGHLDRISGALGLRPAQREKLRQAQAASLEQHLPRRYTRVRVPSGAVGESLSLLLERSRTIPQPRQAPHGRSSRAPDGGALQAYAIAGQREIMARLADLIEQAPSVPHAAGDELLLTTQGKYLLDAEPLVRRHLVRGLQRAIEHGWTISHLWRLDEYTERTLRLLETTLDLAGSRCYVPCYIHPYGLLSPPYEVAIVPGVAAMLMFGAGTTESVDTAFVVTEPALIEGLRSHFQSLREQGRPVFTTFSSAQDDIAHLAGLVDAEAEPGGRILIKDGISAITHPLSWFDEDSPLARHTVHSGLVNREHVARYLALWRQRCTNFEQLVQDYDYLDICPKRTLHKLFMEGSYQLDPQVQGGVATVELRLEHVRRVIHLLRSYPHYKIGLLDEAEEKDVPSAPMRMVAGTRHAVLAAWTLSAEGSPDLVDLHITEPTLVAAFREHLAAQWRKIAPRNRDRRYVIQWLERHAEALERRLAGEM